MERRKVLVVTVLCGSDICSTAGKKGKGENHG
jgi:hypothetical protein